MKLGILGHGVVGSGVTTILNSLNDEDIEVKKILVKDTTEVINNKMTTNSDYIFDDTEIDTIVECMGGIEPAHEYAVKALKAKRNFITSNKKMLAHNFSELITLAKQNKVKLLFEASVGGGIPWIDSLKRIKRVDEISKIEGIFNGTTNYILTKMHKENVSFKEVLKSAQDLGYAEANPSDDIDGFDVKYKVMISSLVSYDALIELDEIATFGIRNIDKEDIAYAKDNNCVFKLVGSSYKVKDKIIAYVIPKLVKEDSLLANVNLNDNALSVTSSYLGTATFIGQGAGSLPTAHAVVQNIIDLKDNNDTNYEANKVEIDNSYASTYYIHSKNIDLYSDIEANRINDNVIITNIVSLDELINITKNDEDFFVAEVVND